MGVNILKSQMQHVLVQRLKFCGEWVLTCNDWSQPKIFNNSISLKHELYKFTSHNYIQITSYFSYFTLVHVREQIKCYTLSFKGTTSLSLLTKAHILDMITQEGTIQTSFKVTLYPGKKKLSSLHFILTPIFTFFIHGTYISY